MATKILKGRSYSCPAPRSLKEKEVARSKSNEECLFDTSKVDQIFDHISKYL